MKDKKIKIVEGFVHWKTPILKRIRHFFLKKTPFSIISNNCWGGFICQYFGIPYTSPFAGLFLFAPDYLKLLENLEGYLGKELHFIDADESKYQNELRKNRTFNQYPIGVLEDVEIHFLHYASREEVLEKWKNRLKRICWDNLIVKFCDRDLATPELIHRFDNLPFEKKVCLVAQKYEYASCLKLKNENSQFVENEWENFKKTVNVVKFMNKLID